MKLNTNAVKRLQKRGVKGFTLIEMIGVLAVIAILAGLLIPKVFGAINDARVNSAVVGCETIKAALVDHYAKYSRFDNGNGKDLDAATKTALVTGGYDTKVLLPEGLIDKAFTTKVGTNATILMRQCAAADATVDGGTSAAYWLSGSGTTSTNEVTGQYVIEAKLASVALADARAISSRIDGQDLSQTDDTADLKGRVHYAPATGASVADVYIYLTHR